MFSECCKHHYVYVRELRRIRPPPIALLDLPTPEGWKDSWLYTEMVHLSAVIRLSSNLQLIATRPRVEPTTAWS